MSIARTGALIPAERRPVLRYLLGALFVETLFFVVLSPLLPVYARELHLSRGGAGLMSACYAIGFALAAVPAGSAVEMIGMRWVSLAGVALVGIACAGFGLAQVAWLLDLARTLTGVGAAGVWAGSVPWVESLGGGRNRGRLLGVAFAAASAGSCAGPAVGALATVVGPRPVFVGLSIMIGMLVVWGAVVSDGAEPMRPQRSRHGVRAELAMMRAALRLPAVSRSLAMVVLPTAALAVTGVLLPLRLRHLGAAEPAIAAAFLTAALLGVLANPAIGNWFDRRGGPSVLRPTLLLAAVFLALLAAPLPAGALLATLVLAAVLLNACWVPSMGQLTIAVDHGGGSPGVAMGLFNLSWAVFQVVGAVGGAELSRLGEPIPFVVLCVGFVAGARATVALETTAAGRGEVERAAR